MKTQTSGFSLLEVMVVVAIIGILAAIALPSYQSHVEKTHLAAAKNNLVDIVSQMRRNKLLNNGNYSIPGLTRLISAQNSDANSRYTFIAGNTNINDYFVYVQPRQRNFTKSLYITAAGTVYECKNVAAAQSRSSADCTLSSR
ncbi:prepilin-type N-terminal cleavage/methylation domain-containing protein [Eikenella sp. S3360]|uniref:Prepilin-type N-terminal cleavage/methylation domain-containing protein n=1 Tax=Eikenella glucosivorans TaxID=2766967 RepID=A0ABS0N8H3_9NEIS|nr:type IV pilin protein [Eikenella glucosivorans]MBH5328603.1 prepilin-type N-terminal cleavage/methylation domain-containing protein [Eikenella glucosivorans]